MGELTVEWVRRVRDLGTVVVRTEALEPTVSSGSSIESSNRRSTASASRGWAKRKPCPVSDLGRCQAGCAGRRSRFPRRRLRGRAPFPVGRRCGRSPQTWRRLAMPETNERSILRMSIGNCWRYASEENPVPKSSMASRTPKALSIFIGVTVVVDVCISADSVSSRTSMAGSNPLAESAPIDVVDDPVPLELLGRDVDRDHEAVTPAVPLGPLRHAVSSTHWPTGTIRPLDSRAGMNSSGWTTPRVGWRQRRSASTPVKAPVERSMVGW